jgi:hypothetical protein
MAGFEARRERDDNMPDDQVKSGDTIRVGNIRRSAGIAIGRHASASVNQGADAQARAFAEILARLDVLEGADADDIADAKDVVRGIEEKLSQGEQVEEGWLARRFRSLARIGPDILDVVTATLLNPAAGVATVVRKIAEKARADAGLAPVATDGQSVQVASS